MLRCFLKSKIHMVTVTEANLQYEGSITVDEDLLDKAGIRPYEQVAVSNLSNGERFETYAIAGKRGSGVVCLNGPTARKAVVGDKLIIFSYAYYNQSEIPEDYHPVIVKVDETNKPI